MLSALIGLLPTVILKVIKPYLEKKADLATTREDNRSAERLKEIDAEIARRTAQKEVLLAEQGSFLTRIVRPLFALPIIIYVWTVVVWDKVICVKVLDTVCATDPLDGVVGEWAGWIVAAYFLVESAERVTRIIKK